jgi:hypothetical protein
MKRSEQAVIIWAVLSLAARMQRVLTYGDIHDFTGVLAVGQAHPLHLIHLYCEKKDYPPLNSIAVNQDTGFPWRQISWRPRKAQIAVATCADIYFQLGNKRCASL